jgi:hypothetical protein
MDYSAITLNARRCLCLSIHRTTRFQPRPQGSGMDTALHAAHFGVWVRWGEWNSTSRGVLKPLAAAAGDVITSQLQICIFLKKCCGKTLLLLVTYIMSIVKLDNVLLVNMKSAVHSLHALHLLQSSSNCVVISQIYVNFKHKKLSTQFS